MSRDRFGIKPLYWYQSGDRFFFASEAKAICLGSDHKFRVNGSAVAQYLDQSLLDTQDTTFFAGIQKVPAGHFIRLSLGDSNRGRPPQSVPFWSIPREIWSGDGVSQLCDKVREVFLDAVSLRLRSDVPVGVLLSGGVDSSSIAAAMLALQPGANLHIISATSDDPRFDEQPFIDRMAKHLRLNVQKVALRFDPRELLSLVGNVTWYNDEPLSGFTTVAHYLLMQRARDLGVTVLLSGQGADELLCGYKKYLGFYLQSLVRQKRYAQAMGTLASFAMRGTLFDGFELREAKRYLPRYFRPRTISVLGPAFRDRDCRLPLGLGKGELVDRQELDLSTYSVPVLTHYEDRTSMAASREVRLPFLDYRLVSLLLSAPPELILRDGWTKWVFRKAMEPMLPPEIAWRKDKRGFSTPIGEWLRSELRDEVQTLLDGEMITAQLGLIDQSKLKQVYRSYCDGKNRWIGSKDIFNPVALEIWARQFQNYLVPEPHFSNVE